MWKSLGSNKRRNAEADFFVVIFTYASLLGSIPLVHGQACDNAVPHCKTCRRSIVSYREEARVPELAT